LTAIPRLKHCNTELQLRAVFIPAALMHEYLISLCCMYELHP